MKLTAEPDRAVPTRLGRAVRLSVPAVLVFAVLASTQIAPTSAMAARLRRPGAPTGINATAVSQGAAVSWTAPVSDGGSPITGYTVTVSHGGGQSCTTTGTTSCTVTGLTGGRQYLVKVRASNAVGLGPGATAYVTPLGAPSCTVFGPYADLQGCDLTLADLDGDDLRGADMSSTNLGGTGLSDAILTGADLTDAQIGGTHLDGADLTGADLVGVSIASFCEDLKCEFANLDNANLTDANLTFARISGPFMSGANLTGAILNGVNSQNVQGTPSALPGNWSLVNGVFVGPGVNVTGDTFIGADFGGTDLYGGNFSSTNLTDANFDGANLTSVDLADADAQGATFTGATLTDVGWSNTTCPDGTNSNSDGGTCVNDLG